MRGFTDYFAPEVAVGLGWLTADPLYRNKLYIVNPNAAELGVRAAFRSTDGEVTVLKTYTVPARSLTVVTSLFDPRDSDFHPFIRANFKDPTSPQAAVTAVLNGDRPFYAFAAVLNDVVPFLGPAGVRSAIVQPDSPP